MKKKLILPALLLCAGMSLQAQQQQASAFYLRPAVSLRAPLQGDSINFTGDKFAMKELLKTKAWISTPIPTTASRPIPPAMSV